MSDVFRDTVGMVAVWGSSDRHQEAVAETEGEI